jgi:hypothetical protein
METFEVTLLCEDDTEFRWSMEALVPEEALNSCLERAEGKSGIYSVWDPEDPHGMPQGLSESRLDSSNHQSHFQK